MFHRVVALCAVSTAPLLLASSAASQWTTLVSRTSEGAQANAASGQPAISSDGHYVTYVSSASNLVADDTNGVDDVFVYNMWFGGTNRVSLGASGIQGNAASGNEKAPLSDDGRYVVFVSAASNLVLGDTNNRSDLFLRDRQTNSTSRVSVDAAGNQLDYSSEGGAISADGRYVVYDSDSPQLWPADTNLLKDVFVVEVLTGTLTCASVNSLGATSNGESLRAAISADGRWVAFTSSGSDLVADDTNGTWDTFLRDLVSGQTWRVSVDSLGQQGNGLSNSVRVSLSADGRYVAFLSLASNLVPNDTNGVQDVFVHDHLTLQTERVSTSSTGLQAADANGGCSISGDGQYVAFGSFASNLVPDDTNDTVDIFVKDRLTGVTTRVSVGEGGQEANGANNNPRISTDGRLVTFQSLASNLVAGDDNGASDIFVRDWQTICGPFVGQYCVSAINTTGEGARIDWQGSTSIAQNDLVLKVDHCPPSHNGIFFFGCYQTQIPFGEGMLCVTGNQHRLPIVHLDANGAGSYALDFTDALTSATRITAGSLWNFQFWYRDAQTVGHGFNLSNALSAQFCP